MRFAVAPDPKGAGVLVAAEARRRGHEVTDRNPQAAYVRTANFGGWRERQTGALRRYRDAGVPTVPGPAAIDLYDDKLAQLPALGPWLPKTYLIRAPADVAAALDALTLPFVSKSAEGAASHNVRLIRNADEARAEAAAVFGPGLRIKGGMQRGYLYWQALAPGNDHDVRPIVIGDHWFGITRGNRDDVPFASGGGRNTPITEGDDRTRLAFGTARKIAGALGLRWACFDFVFGESGKPFCLEVSFSWVEAVYHACPLFAGPDFAPTGRPMTDWPRIAVDELERIAA